MWILAQETVTTVSEVQGHYGNLIFMGCFFIAAIIVGIWWLKRNA